MVRSFGILLMMVLVCISRSPADDGLVDDFREFARAESGDDERGRVVFSSEGAKCRTCHSVGEDERRPGPDLVGIADKYDREGIIRAVLEPSRDLAPGYRTIAVATRSGEVHTGILQRRGPDGIDLLDAAGMARSLDATDVVSVDYPETSLMPDDLFRSLTKEDFASLVTWLETLHAPPLDDRRQKGMPAEIPALESPVRLEPLFSDALRFDQPVWISAVPGQGERYVVLEHRRGKVWLLDLGGASPEKRVFADLDADVSDGPWEGLMAIAFHPDYPATGRYFVKHETIEADRRQTVVVERRAREDRLGDAGVPSRRLLEIPQPADNHNGGTIAFGPDGYLYCAMGDGGPQEDPNGYSQNRGEWLGAMLRIDVDQRDDDRPYGVPPTNPWLGVEGAGPEVWAIGFREPWRFSFDSVTGDLWLGDVGQNRFEEVAIVRAGENHGWNVYEGFVPFSERYRRDGELYVPPVFSYERKHGVSITGGHVYRARPEASTYGVYICGDFESRRIWGVTQTNRVLDCVVEIGQAPERIASFGVDATGEILLVGYDGMVWRLGLDRTAFPR